MIQREPSALAHRHMGGPVRTCVGCRKRELAVELLRVVAVPTGNGGYAVIVDTGSNLPGRGAWLHPAPYCAHQAIRRRVFARALRITGSPDTSAVIEHIDRAPDRPVNRTARQQNSPSTEQPVNRTGSKEHEHTVKSR